MKLHQLTKLEAGKIQKESEEKRSEIVNLQEVLRESSKLHAVLKNELLQMRKQYGDARRTEIRPESVNFDVEPVIRDEQVLIFLTNDGYVKRVGSRSFQVLERGAPGIPSIDLKEQDKVLRVISARTLQTMVFITNQGKAYTLKVHEIPEGTRSARGTPITNLLQLTDDEKVSDVVPVDAFPSTQYLTLITRKGTVKRTPLEAFSNVRSTGIITAQLDDTDSLARVLVTTGDGQIAVTTRDGLTIRFEESDISVMGRTARGVVGIRLEEDSEVVGACFLPHNRKGLTILTVGKRGYGKRTPADAYRLQKRGGSGVASFNVNSKSGTLIGVLSLTERFDVLLVSERGQALRVNSNSIPLQRRTAAGNRLVKLNESDEIASITEIPSEVSETEATRRK